MQADLIEGDLAQYFCIDEQVLINKVNENSLTK